MIGSGSSCGGPTAFRLIQLPQSVSLADLPESLPVGTPFPLLGQTALVSRVPFQRDSQQILIGEEEAGADEDGKKALVVSGEVGAYFVLQFV